VFTVTFVLYKKDGLDRSEALRYWRETHGPLVRDVPGVQRYVSKVAARSMNRLRDGTQVLA